MSTTLERVAPFRNETVRTFSDPAERASLEAALQRVGTASGQHYPVIIDGKPVETEKRIVSYNPAHPDEI
ncbi:MAG: L-glutamate gamma-semialdehyde dehydrogenase, partial [Candidatus Eremiobacteraeota bacterium]|nr:L-glutamate gamma-semialdehyde dehydrogenase [Candidatus Eremiobacteraeota bacterium]